MGFYYGSNQPPEDKPGGWRETLAIIWAVFSVLALPMGLLFAGLGYLLVLFFLFTTNAFLGLAWLGVAVLAVLARGVWEARHPPKLP